MNRAENRRLLEQYLGAINRHEVAEALAYLADSFVLEFSSGPKLDKRGVENALGWDAGTEGRVEWRITEEEANALTVEGEETNEFLRLLGIEPLQFRSRFSFGEDGLIAGQRHEVDWSGVSVNQALSPAVAWARDNAADELAEVYPDEQMTYTARAGRGWVSLLRRWSESRT